MTLLCTPRLTPGRALCADSAATSTHLCDDEVPAALWESAARARAEGGDAGAPSISFANDVLSLRHPHTHSVRTAASIHGARALSVTIAGPRPAERDREAAQTAIIATHQTESDSHTRLPVVASRMLIASLRGSSVWNGLLAWVAARVGRAPRPGSRERGRPERCDTRAVVPGGTREAERPEKETVEPEAVGWTTYILKPS